MTFLSTQQATVIIVKPGPKVNYGSLETIAENNIYPLPIHFTLRCTAPSAKPFQDRVHGKEPATPALFEAARIEIGFQSRVLVSWGQYLAIVGEEIGWLLFHDAVDEARATGDF